MTANGTTAVRCVNNAVAAAKLQTSNDRRLKPFLQVRTNNHSDKETSRVSIEYIRASPDK